MKNSIKCLIIINFIFLSLNNSRADNPAYSLSAQNFVLTAPNVLDFDIYIKHLNPGVSTFQFSLAEYIFNFNLSYLNGGDVTFSFAPGENSDLPVNARPRNALVRNNILRLTSNSLLGKGSGPIISSAGYGTKVTRVRLQTTASSFSGNLGLSWRNSSDGHPDTKLYAYLPAGGVNITNPSSHNVNNSDSGSINIKLAIEGFLSDSILNIRDTVRAYLRSVSTPYMIVDSSVSVIDSLALSGAFSFLNAPGGTYYIVVKHRNSIQTWSKSGGESYLPGLSMNYDFTTAASNAFGDNLILKGSIYCIYSGDVNQDEIIDASDISNSENDASVSLSGYVNSDVTGDYYVDAGDISIIENNITSSVIVITP